MNFLAIYSLREFAKGMSGREWELAKNAKRLSGRVERVRFFSHFNFKLKNCA